MIPKIINERLRLTRVIVLFGVLFLSSCKNKMDQSSKNILTVNEVIETSLNTIGDKATREKVKNLVSKANCVSPNGNYTTEIQTATNGYSYFKQVFSYKPESFEAVIENKTSGYSIGDSLKPLSKESLSVIREHEFQNIVLEVNQRFHDFELIENEEKDGINNYKLKAKDELGKTNFIFFDEKTRLLTEIHFPNPSDENEMIKTKFSNWKKTNNLQLPYHVEINQSGKLYTFDYTKLILNSPDFKYKNVKNEN